MAPGPDFPSELNAFLCLLRLPDLFRAVGTCTHSGEMSHAYKQQGTPMSRCAQPNFAITRLRTPLQGILLARRGRGLTLRIELFILYDLRTSSGNGILADSSRRRAFRSHKGKDMSNGVKRTVLILDLASSAVFRTLHWQDHLPVVWRIKVKTEKQCFECFDDALRRPVPVLRFLALALEVERSETCRPWLLFNGDAPKLFVLKLDVVPKSELEVISTVATLELDWDYDCGDGPSTRTLLLILSLACMISVTRSSAVENVATRRMLDFETCDAGANGDSSRCFIK